MENDEKMSLIESTYIRLKDYNEVKNSDEFSVRYLKRCKSYYRTIKAMNIQPSYEVMCNLMIELETRVEEEPRNALYRQLASDTAEMLVSNINVRNVCSKTSFRVSVIAVQPSYEVK